jgi:hypothetical protein
LLVDTPGVNDPDNWREEITYSYLANADAVIMLLDPMQPLSASEVEFLDKKILSQSIANLIFVVNKIDDVSIEERASALKRIESMLSKHVPNPLVLPVSAKSAFKAKQMGDESLLKSSGFPLLEERLLNFLAKGRGGMLLNTKVCKALDHLAGIENSIQSRQAALDSQKDVIIKKMRETEKDLERIKDSKEKMGKGIKAKESEITAGLMSVINSREAYLNSSLKPALVHEPDLEMLKANVLTFQRDSMQIYRNALQTEYNKLLNQYEAPSRELEFEVKNLMSNLANEASNASQTIQVERSMVTQRYDHGTLRSGAALGGGLGAAAGMAVASGLTTTTITATGALATTAALGTAGIIGVGVLTGGLGLLIGLFAAGMLSKRNQENQPSQGYISTQEMVNNSRACLAMDRFIENLKRTTSHMSKVMIEAALREITGPIEDEIENKKALIKQIETDLDQTAREQQGTREFLGKKRGETEGIRKDYEGLLAEMGR